MYPYEAKHAAISYELLDSGLIDMSWVVPTTPLANFNRTGDEETYRQEYFNFLMSPVVFCQLNAELLKSDGYESDVLFMHYSMMEKEMLYPKFLRNFIVNYLEVPGKYIVKYKNYSGFNKKFDFETFKRIEKNYRISSNKLNEVNSVLFD